jgi:signal transduction histidine kinase
MDGEPFNIVSDPRRVRQILLNLLSNAIKFGEGKPIRVTCKQDANRGVELEVVDEGVGIAKDDISRIFEEFVQVSESKQPGTGLGLPISRRLAQLLDGSLSVHSEPSHGSAFRLTLPASLEDDMTPTAELSAATAA